MSRFKKILLGIATVWPFAYIILFMLFVFLLIFVQPGGDGFGALFLLIIPVHMLTIFLAIGMQIFYIVDTFRNERVEKNQQIMWVILLVLLGLLAMPVYWYLNIWREVPGGDKYRGLESGAGFEAARTNEWETESNEPVQPEPHGWRQR